MTYHQMREFLIVSEYLSFSEAAKYLYITQPALGRQIMALEKELNIQLFVRSPLGLKLTPAGRYLKKEWTELLHQWDNTIQQAGIIQRGYSGMLSLGILDGIDVGVFLSDKIKKYDFLYPDVNIQLTRGGFQQLRENLYQGIYDAIITYSMELEIMQGVCYKHLYQYHPAWIVPISNPLSQKSELRWSDFKDQELVITNKTDTVRGNNIIIESCRKYGGFYPRFFYTNTVGDTILQMETSNRCAVLNLEMDIVKSDLVRVYPLPLDESKEYFTMIWKEDNNNICLKQFVNMLEENSEKNM